MNKVVKVQNHDVTVIEWNNERVVTTPQLAELYDTDADNIRHNFSRNTERFEEGKHFYLLKGEELQQFKDHMTDCHVVNQRSSHVYLWTQRGASRHCKMLGTDKSWDVFDCLEEAYFNPQFNTSDLSPELRLLINMERQQKAQEKRLAEVEANVQATRDIIALNPNSWRDDALRMIVKIAQKMGGNEYISTVHNEIYKLLDERFKVNLSVRLTNMRRRMAEEGVSKSRRDKANRLDVIAEDKKLIEGFLIIVKEMAIKYGVTEVA